MKLPADAAEEAIFFLAGSLPLAGLLHLRCLSLFNMICHLKDNVLNKIAKLTLLMAQPSNKSWFTTVRDICCQYGIQHPLQLLECPMPSIKFKALCKEKVHEYWHRKLASNSSMFSSLRFLQPDFLTLLRPHPIWSTLDGNPYQTKAAAIQALFLTGRYRTERLCRFWSKNKDGFCLLDSCLNLKKLETLEHVLLQCESLIDERRRLLEFMKDFCSDKPVIKNLVDLLFHNENNDFLRMQFLVDCSVLPAVIQAAQVFGNKILESCFALTRSWCRSLHKARMKKMGRFSSF